MDAGARRSFVDLHCHSSASFDSLSKPADLVRMARRIGLTHLAITDHEHLDGALRARDLAGDDLTIIVGEEIRTQSGDLIGLYLERAIPPGLPLPEAAAAIREQGGVVGLPHPFDGFRSSGGAKSTDDEEALDAIARAVDYVEVHNARAVGRANERAAVFANQRGLPGVASSDAHAVMEVGVSYTVLPGDFASPAELRALLPDASLIMGRASYYVRAWTPVAKLVQRARGNPRVTPPVDAPDTPPGGSDTPPGGSDTPSGEARP